jgi:hypothetical protein
MLLSQQVRQIPVESVRQQRGEDLPHLQCYRAEEVHAGNDLRQAEQKHSWGM